MNGIRLPYHADYNDHFETPLIAYKDILPLLDSICESLSSTRAGHILFDPFYCSGQAKVHLESLGFQVQHEKRDFYKDLKDSTIPFYHTLVTNPPYSEHHKESIIKYAVGKLRDDKHRNPFFLLMPNYVAIKKYFLDAVSLPCVDDDTSDIFYILPSTSYHYTHPDGTGKDESPFSSIWYCGLPRDMAVLAKETYATVYGNHDPLSGFPRLVSTLEQLKEHNAVPLAIRPNPRQRRKRKRRTQKLIPQSGFNEVKNIVTLSPDKVCIKRNSSSYNDEAKISGKKSSIHRDENGVRRKPRF